PRFVVADLAHLPWPSYFDVLICAEVLEHVEDHSRVLNGFKRALRPPGRLLVTIPNPFGFFEIDSLLWRAINSQPGGAQRLYAVESKLFTRYGSEAILARRKAEYEPERLARTWSTLSTDQSHAHALS